jgi:hypothetical protein
MNNIHLKIFLSIFTTFFSREVLITYQRSETLSKIVDGLFPILYITLFHTSVRIIILLIISSQGLRAWIFH